jgi:hypothetical protein
VVGVPDGDARGAGATRRTSARRSLAGVAASTPRRSGEADGDLVSARRAPPPERSMVERSPLLVGADLSLPLSLLLAGQVARSGIERKFTGTTPQGTGRGGAGEPEYRPTISSKGTEPIQQLGSRGRSPRVAVGVGRRPRRSTAPQNDVKIPALWSRAVGGTTTPARTFSGAIVCGDLGFRGQPRL